MPVGVEQRATPRDDGSSLLMLFISERAEAIVIDDLVPVESLNNESSEDRKRKPDKKQAGTLDLLDPRIGPHL